jgi:ketosteroid isomerase-like protein
MSHEQVERLYRAYETFNVTKRIDRSAVAVDVVMIAPNDILGGGVVRGREALERHLQDLTETFDNFRVEVEQIFDHGDRILAFVRLRGRAHGSGIPLDVPLAHLWTVRDGVATEQHIYVDREEALEAVGLRLARRYSRSLTGDGGTARMGR